MDILFVDDEPQVRETVYFFFKVKGLKVTAATTCAEALTLAQTTKFAAAIFDVTLPRENGLDLLQQFKRRHPDIPAFIFTALADDTELRDLAFARGACGCFSKGDSLHALADAVLQAIRDPKQSS